MVVWIEFYENIIYLVFFYIGYLFYLYFIFSVLRMKMNIKNFLIKIICFFFNVW